MKVKLLNIGAIFLVLLGIGLVSYPTVSNWLSERNASRAIQEYDEEVAQMSAQRIEAEFAKAKKFNDALAGAKIEDPFMPGSGMVLPDNYTSVLDVIGNGIIGHIEIPEIDIYLLIYHGVAAEVLQKGVGHMENTAFPIGGEDSHPVLTGHSGLSFAKLFTDLEKLALEDVFYIKVLDQTIAYQIDQILVVEPHETEALRPVKGEDYVSLVTCTPYAINSHRLLVRGTRIPYVEDVEQVANSIEINWCLVMIVAFVMITAVSYAIYQYKKKRKVKWLLWEEGE